MLRRFFTQARALMGIMHGSRAFGGPVQSTIHLTNRCNLRCIHCYYYSPYLEKPNFRAVRLARHENSEIPEDDYVKHQNIEADHKRTREIIEELINLGTYRFQFSGQGEIFLYKNLMELIELVKYAGCYSSCFTNGTLLTKDIIDRLVKIQFDELKISVMAGNSEMYLQTHPGANSETFSKLKDDLSYFSDRKKSLKTVYPKVTLVYVIIKQNYKGLMDFARLASLVNADNVLYNPVDEVGDTGLVKLTLNQEEIKYVREELMNVSHYLEKEKINHNIKYVLNIFNGQLDTSEFYRVIPCYYGWLSAIIEISGKVYPCCRCYNHLGNIYKKSFKQIWNDTPYIEFRNKIIKINKGHNLPDGCDCHSCVHYMANLKIYNLLNPFTKKYKNYNEAYKLWQ